MINLTQFDQRKPIFFNYKNYMIEKVIEMYLNYIQIQKINFDF